MKKIIRYCALLLIGCIGLGGIVSKLEKKRGWVEGHKPKGVYEEHIKRPLDFGVALFMLILLWPVLLLIAIAVRVNMGKQVLFVQERPGLGGEIFKIYKFRTMTDARDAEGKLLPDDQRLTRFGQWLRACSGDELGELWNIVKGDLAIVGPRPLLVEYLPRYSEEQRHRHDVRPGLTGYAQTEGRNLCSWKERFEKDLKYVNNITFIEDFKIILKTIIVIIKKEGIHSNNSATMEDFMGNKE